MCINTGQKSYIRDNLHQFQNVLLATKYTILTFPVCTSHYSLISIFSIEIPHYKKKKNRFFVVVVLLLFSFYFVIEESEKLLLRTQG